MSLFQRVKAAGQALFANSKDLMGAVTETSLPNGVLDFMMRFGKVPDVSQDALVRKYFGWTYSCTNLSATRLATVPLRLYSSRGVGETKVKNFRAKPVHKKQEAWLKSRIGKSLQHVAGAEDFEELEEHPLLDLLQNVNDHENSFELKELTSVMLDMTGNAYWLLERDKLSVPTKLFVLRSQYIRIIPDRERFIKGYWYGYNNAWGVDTRLELEPEEVIHFKYPNPLDPWYGMGCAQAAAYAIESNELREKFVLATMNNMARPDLIVKYLEGELDPRERQAVEREWNTLFRGAKNAGKVKVTDFRYEVDKIGWTPEELDFNKGEDWILKKICSVFPVPLGLVDSSQISRAPRSGMEGSDLYMATFNTLPRCTRLEEKLNEQLCPLYDERLFLAFDNPVPKDRVMQNNEDQQRLASFQTTVNEIRKREGEDEVEWGDRPIGPAGVGILDLRDPEVKAQEQADQQAAQAEAQAARIQAQGFGKKPGEKPLFGKEGKPGKDQEAEQAKQEEELANAGEVEKGVADALANGNLEVEVAGEHVHPDLAGIPLRVRARGAGIRNEHGRFHKPGQHDIRIDRATARLLMGKSVKGSDDGNVQWITVNGAHIPIKEGQSKDETVREHLDRQGGKKPSVTGDFEGGVQVEQGKANDYFQKHGITGSADQAQITRNIGRGKTLAEAVKLRNSRLESERRRALGDDLFEEMLKEGTIKLLPNL